MSEVQRYSVAVFNGDGWASKDSDGDLVEYEDYAALKAERDALAAENSALIAGYEKVKDELSSIYHSDGWSVSEDGESETAVIEFDGALSVVTDVRSEIKTKDTDAFLLNVQADGAEQCGIHLRYWYDYMVEERANEFAAQLRSQAEELQKEGA